MKTLLKANPNKIRESKFDRAFSVVNIILLVFMVILVGVPVLNYFSLAFNHYAYNNKVSIIPAKFSFRAMGYVLGGEYDGFWRAFLNSVIITFVVTFVSNFVEALAAYPLSKSDCPCKSGIMMYFIITMLFSAGIVPIYLLMRTFNLLNNIWSIILISISNVMNLLFFKTFFEGLPNDIEEAAVLDGASSLQLFVFVIIPMSLPVFGSCCFFSIVGCWNGIGSALIFIDSQTVSQQPLAYFLYIKLSEGNSAAMYDDFLRDWGKNIEAASMFVSIIPILFIYPYVVRYIKGGLTIGSVKG